MRVIKEFNNISDKLLATIPVLEPGETKTFFMLTGATNIDPDPKEQARRPVIYPKARIPMKDRIYDPFKTKWIDIGVPTEVNGDQITRFQLFVPGKGEAVFMGRFSLVGGRDNDDEVFQYLWLTNYRNNPENKHRNSSITPMFEYLDVEAETIKAKIGDDVLFNAMSRARDMSEKEMKDYIASLNLAPIDKPEVLAATVSKMSRQDPETFLKQVGSPDIKVKATAKKASEEGIIKYDAVAGDILFGNNNMVIATLAKKDGVNWLDGFAEWVKTHPEGRTVYANIEKMLNGEEQKELA